MSDETFDVWPHDPTKIVKEALREYVGDGDGEDERVLAAHEKRVRERIARNIEAKTAREVAYTLGGNSAPTDAQQGRAGVIEWFGKTTARIVREGA